MFRQKLLSAVLVTAWLVASAGVASADPFAMSSVLNNFCCTDWTGKDAPTSAPNPGGGAFGILGGAIVQPATVNRTVDQTLSTAPFNMMIPANLIGAHGSLVGFAHPNPLWDVLNIAIDVTNKSGTMSAGGGPGTFEFCPLGVGPAPGACAAPLSATGGPSSLPVHGRISVTAGINQYGGAMGWLGDGLTGTNSVRNAAGAAATLFTFRHFAAAFSVFGDGTTSMGIIKVATNNLPETFYTTSQHSLFTGTPEENPAFVSVANGPGAVTGHIWTTGMVTASITAGGNVPPFQAVTMTGSDTRETTGPNIGSGNLTLVSGGLYQDYSLGVPTVRGTTILMTVPEPVAGLAVAAGAIALLLAGGSRRRG
jgi:hypothetical protein